jgi:hypothetical protein
MLDLQIMFDPGLGIYFCLVTRWDYLKIALCGGNNSVIKKLLNSYQLFSLTESTL